MGILLAIGALSLIIVWLARRRTVQSSSTFRSRRAGPRPRLAGSTDVVDRDAERVLADLHARGGLP